MMLLALALMAQTADLPANTVEAARLCAVSARSWEATPVEASSRVGYFTLVATRETRANKLVAEHIPDEAGIIADLAKTAKAVALDACRKRFPLAFAARVALPADSFERRLACIMASGFVVGLTEHLNDPEISRRYKATYERFVSMVGDDEFARHGVSSDAQVRTLADRYLGGIVDLGGPLAIVATCETAFPT